MRIENYETGLPVEEFLENYVDIEKFHAACEKCPLYGMTWACPPLDFDAEGFWRKYKHVSVFCRKFIFEDEEDYPEDLQEFFYAARKKIAEEMYVREEEQPGSISLLGGACNICGIENCTRRQGKPCRFPKYMRRSLEALGGDAEKMAEDFFGIKVEWPSDGKLEFMVFVTVLLRP